MEGRGSSGAAVAPRSRSSVPLPLSARGTRGTGKTSALGTKAKALGTAVVSGSWGPGTAGSLLSKMLCLPPVFLSLLSHARDAALRRDNPWDVSSGRDDRVETEMTVQARLLRGCACLPPPPPSDADAAAGFSDLRAVFPLGGCQVFRQDRSSRKPNDGVCGSRVRACTTLGIHRLFLPSSSLRFLGTWAPPLQAGMVKAVRSGA